MTNFGTLSDALDDLRRRGFVYDFNLHSHCIRCREPEVELSPDDFEITEVHRFEGASNPDDNEVVYAITGKNGLKGVLIDAYGAYSDALSAEMIHKLRVRHRDISPEVPPMTEGIP